MSAALMAAETAPECDVAVSFLTKDQPTAQAIAEQLEAPGLKVFFFPRRQEELAGTNGMESMRAPFLSARVNVVLFRRRLGRASKTPRSATAV